MVISAAMVAAGGLATFTMPQNRLNHSRSWWRAQRFRKNSVSRKQDGGGE